MAVSGGPLAVICSQFPEMHETFVERELSALEASGVPMRIYSMKFCRDPIVHPGARKLADKTVYLAWDDWRTWTHAAREFVQHPVRAVRGLFWAKTRHLSSASDFLKALVVWVQSLAFSRRLRADGAAHIHAHWATAPTSLAFLVSTHLGIRFSFTAHAWDIFLKNPSLAEKVRTAEFVLTCTDYNRQYLQALCPGEKNKIILNYHGVDVQKFEPAGSVKSDFQTPLFLSIGRLVEQKGFKDLLDACRILKERGVCFRAMIVGNGPLKGMLLNRIRASGLEGCVDWLPGAGQEEIRQMYGKAYAFVLPCVIAANGDRDGIPNVILEAMAMGLPVISTGISGLPEAVIPDVSGLAVPAGDPAALAGAMEHLVRHPEVADLLGRGARKLAVEKFDDRMHLERLKAHFALA